MAKKNYRVLTPEELRLALKARVDHGGLTNVAREIGLDKSILSKFVNGLRNSTRLLKAIGAKPVLQYEVPEAQLRVRKLPAAADSAS